MNGVNGPWRSFDDMVFDRDGHMVVEGVSEAHGRLIAAAPEMAAIIREAIDGPCDKKWLERAKAILDGLA